MPLITNKKQTHSLTTYSLITKFEKESLILASPITGRKHQIRKHFSMIGHPIIGDDKFGAKKATIFFFILFILNLKMKMKKIIKLLLQCQIILKKKISKMNINIEKIKKRLKRIIYENFF